MNIACLTGLIITMLDSVTFHGPLYLVKLQSSNRFGSRDLLWAIGQKMKDPLDYEGMRGLVVGGNNLGLFAPKLSSDSITWGQIKAQIAVQAMSQNGTPITLLENVHSFYQIMYFAYDSFVLKNEAGLKVLDSLTAGEDTAGVNSVQGSSMTVREAGEGAADLAKKYREGKVKKEVVEDVVEAVMEDGLSVWEENEKGQFVLKPGGAGIPHGTELADVMVRMKDSPACSTLGSQELVIEGGEGYFVPEVGAMEEVVAEHQGKLVSAGIDEVDRMIEQLEESVTEESAKGWKEKASMYKTVVKNLRAKVRELQEGNVKLVKENDLGKKRLSEY